MGCHFLLQGIFPTQGLNSHLSHLLHCFTTASPGTASRGTQTKPINKNTSYVRQHPSEPDGSKHTNLAQAGCSAPVLREASPGSRTLARATAPTKGLTTEQHQLRGPHTYLEGNSLRRIKDGGGKKRSKLVHADFSVIYLKSIK